MNYRKLKAFVSDDSVVAASHVVREQEEDKVLIVGDTIEKKPHTQESELIGDLD